MNEYIDLNKYNNYYYILTDNFTSGGIFIEYINYDYKIISEDDVRMKLLNNIKNTHDNELISNKNILLNELILNIKEYKNMFNLIPESITIQNVLKFFYTFIFNNKDAAKYFLCILGDNILNKSNDIDYFCNTGKQLIDKIYDNIKIYYKINNKKFRFNITSRSKIDMSNCRIITFKDIDMINYKVYWDKFIVENILNIIAVSCHYSNRYNNAENFVFNNNIENKDKILYLYHNSINDILNKFITTMHIKKVYNKKLSLKDILYLWNMFKINNKLPNVITHKTFTLKIKEILLYDNRYFKGYYSMYVNKTDKFNIFWNKYFKISGPIGYINGKWTGPLSFELSEIVMLYTDYLKKNDELNYSINEKTLLDIIKHYHNHTYNNNYSNNKIQRITCVLWDKLDDIYKFLGTKLFNINDTISFEQLYLLYLQYITNNKKYTVSKNYFYICIDKIIPKGYKCNNIILKGYWNMPYSMIPPMFCFNA